MGQKVNPTGLRMGINQSWRSKWYVDPREYAATLHEDLSRASPAGPVALPDVETVLSGLAYHCLLAG